MLTLRLTSPKGQCDGSEECTPGAEELGPGAQVLRAIAEQQLADAMAQKNCEPAANSTEELRSVAENGAPV